MVPFVSLDGASSVTDGVAADLQAVFTNHSIIAAGTGGTGGCTVALEGSHDGDLWIAVASTTIGDGSLSILTVTDTPLRYLRASITHVSGGSPAVKATVAAA